MKYHRHYKERIVSFLTAFELNKWSITQKWIENKFYSLDKERTPSMPEWISKATCLRCKKKEHLAFNCPDKILM